MKTSCLLSLLLGILCLPNAGSAQGLTAIHNPLVEDTTKVELSQTEKNIMNRLALPKVRKRLASQDFCEESFEPAAVLHGSFTRARAEQTIIFYQYCQTGNGLGEVGVVLIEGTKMLGNYIADTGWSVGGKTLPDINRNGLDEFSLYYSGGIHQGAGGTGVDIMEFAPAGLKALGWFQADSFSDDGNDFSYQVSVRPGKTPVFYRQKYVSNDSGKFTRVGRQTAFRLSKAVSNFEAVK